MSEQKLNIEYIDVSLLKPAEYNPRKWDEEAISGLTESVQRFGVVDPIICNSAPGRLNVIIGGHFRYFVAKKLGIQTIPVVYVHISDLEKEKELNLRLNKNLGDWDWDLLKGFDESFLADSGFSSEDLDEIFATDPESEEFDLEKELEKMNIAEITVQKGDVYDLDGSRLMCGDSTNETEFMKLMNGEKADMCYTDEPYILDYLKGRKKEGFGLKKDRRYLETESLPENFMDLWMANVSKVQKPDFSIISFENWKNLKDMWIAFEKHWKIRNVIIWNCQNRSQGYSSKYRFFSKYDIAFLGSSGEVKMNEEPEEELLQNEYESAIFATSGKPHWESYEKGKKTCPTDVITFKTEDEKSSGQGLVFGCKPVQIIIPYLKTLTKRGDLIVEPFGGSGSTLIAATMMKRRCYVMEKVPVYTQVIIRRWEKLTGKKAVKI
ncbi:MAG: DNA methyltransferase [Candidatus Roizmanbacteria bacterium]|nr:DNA methyltransferase [Candidatus Roizmanbacteria bacterium]